MAEPQVVVPLTSVRSRPVTPQRIDSTTPLVAEMADATVSEAVAARHARSTRAEGTISKENAMKEHKQDQHFRFRDHEQAPQGLPV
jgi:hypothetical protein